MSFFGTVSSAITLLLKIHICFSAVDILGKNLSAIQISSLLICIFIFEKQKSENCNTYNSSQAAALLALISTSKLQVLFKVKYCIIYFLVQLEHQSNPIPVTCHGYSPTSWSEGPTGSPMDVSFAHPGPYGNPECRLNSSLRSWMFPLL